MYIRESNYNNAIQKVTIEVGTYVGLKEDEEAFITLKELPTMETLKLKKSTETEEEILSFFKEVLPVIIVDHNFYESETKKMTNEALRDFIFERMALSTKILKDYSHASFFSQRRIREEK